MRIGLPFRDVWPVQPGKTLNHSQEETKGLSFQGRKPIGFGAPARVDATWLDPTRGSVSTNLPGVILELSRAQASFVRGLQLTDRGGSRWLEGRVQGTLRGHRAHECNVIRHGLGCRLPTAYRVSGLDLSRPRGGERP